MRDSGEPQYYTDTQVQFQKEHNYIHKPLNSQSNNQNSAADVTYATTSDLQKSF